MSASSKPDLRPEIFRKLIDKYGFSLIRLNGKRPIEQGWTRYCNEKRLFQQIGFEPGDNAGICCGPASGIIVIDIDDETAFSSYCRNNNYELPETFTVKTGSGKRHLYYRYPQDGKSYRNRSLRNNGFDIRADGGMVVAPGAIHPVTRHPYVIEKDLPIADAPEWLQKLSSGAVTTKHSLTSNFASLPSINVNALPLSERIKRIIVNGKPKGQRSEAMWCVVLACIQAGLSDDDILSIFYNYQIGEKFWENNCNEEWLLKQVRKAEKWLANPQALQAQLRPNPPVRGDEEFVRKILYTPINGITQFELTVPATGKLFDMLYSYGNRLSYEHRAALWELMKTYTTMAQGLKGRLVYPLPTGAGKTLSIVAWISTLVEIGADHISVAVCTSRVEALCDIKRRLLECGVPEERIGLLHSYKYSREKAKAYLDGLADIPAGYASEPSDEEAQDRQILLITHSRVKMSGELEKYAYYKGKPRDLLIWDESLFTSNAESLNLEDIKSTIGWLEPKVEKNRELEPLISHLKEYLRVLTK